ncbi:MAG: 2-C-methyl-D-erythritol 2,4-cyclodiphosphate synthase [Clostridiales bacterium]|jgi:2-C-methyl-D-erythritol 4-phosphate cytidylyltransferase/2-C-methyl-D-erythritol 2,4-cyclodiphosphate synthase|nr:2-C-methyl-D-erythritol 2,4-cyclodiphosphate synthase [Clostridiales bacterium]
MNQSTTYSNTTAILLAAGCGTRAHLGYNKILYNCGDYTVLERAYFALRQVIPNIVVVVSKEDQAHIQKLLKPYMPVVVVGGSTRYQSVKCGLDAIVSNRILCDIVLIHDAARCNVDSDTIRASIESATKYGSGIACIQATDSIKIVKDNTIVDNLQRNTTHLAQTPQSFGFRDIYCAYHQSSHDNYTDDATVYMDYGLTAYVSQGNPCNTKLTYSNDFGQLVCHNLKIGHGYDVHRLAEGYKLILGGLVIPYSLGLVGHSDADVLTHAIMDALLSAAGLPDIGVLFPDTDSQYKGANSINLLRHVHNLIVDKNCEIVNISAVVMAEQPKLATHISNIEERLATALGIPQSNIKISATTTENLGVIANNNGIASTAMCLIKYNNKV